MYGAQQVRPGEVTAFPATTATTDIGSLLTSIMPLIMMMMVMMMLMPMMKGMSKGME